MLRTIAIILALLATNLSYGYHCLGAKETQVTRLQTDDMKTLSLKIENVSMFVHFANKDSEVAQKVKDVIENDLPKLHQYFDYKPKADVHFVISNQTQSNGFATVFPRNQIVLNNYPPTGGDILGFSKDWLRNLVIHEYTHILTLEMTHGVFSVLRKVFGSTVKVAGVLPQWVSEGIAVWAESYFTGEGRLNNPRYLFELTQSYQNPKMCKKIDCLDEPKSFPFGSYPYLIGGYFLQYIEMQKGEKTLSCIFKNNSYKIPFFFANAVKQCTQQDLNTLWDNFQVWIKSLKESNESVCPLNDASKCFILNQQQKKNGDFFVDWDKGFFASGDSFVFALSMPKTSTFTYHQERYLALLNFSTKKLTKRRIQFSLDKIYPLGGDLGFGVTYFRSEFGTDVRKHMLYRINKENLELVDKLGDSFQASYYFPGPQSDLFWEVDYSDSKWQSRLLDKKGQPIGEKKFFNTSENIYYPQVQNNEIVFYSKEMDKLNHFSSSITPKFSLNQKEVTDYSHLDYFNLNYLLAFFSYNQNLSVLALSTSISDPLEKFKLDLGVKNYFGIADGASPFRFNLGYQYKIANQTWASLDYDQSLSKFSGSNQTYVTNTLGLSLVKRFYYKRFTSDWILGLSNMNTQDISTPTGRKINQLSLKNSWNYQNDSIRGALRAFSFSTQFLYNKNSIKDFVGAKLNSNLIFRLLPYWSGQWSVHYGHQFKKTLNNGLLFGGGASSTLTGSYLFDSYAFSYGSLVGNKVMTSIFELKNTLWQPMRGSGLFPLFFKQFDLVYGAEMDYADFAYNPSVGRYNIHNKFFPSGFVGLEINTDIAYRFPAFFKLIYSYSLDSQIGDSRISLLITTPFLP